MIEKYAQLAVTQGVNLQPNQTLVINSDVKNLELVEALTKAAYDCKAKQVIVNWASQEIDALTLKNGEDSIFDVFFKWREVYYEQLLETDFAIISISSSDPDGFKGVDPSRLMRLNRAAAKPTEKWKLALMSNQFPWCVIAAPCKQWAQKVFPDLSEQKAVEQLWDYIFKACRLDQNDPIASWQEHKKMLNVRSQKLNEAKYEYLHFTNELGTDLKVELPKNYKFKGANEITPKKQEFVANMPTEEIFTLPKKDGVNGVVYSSLPLNYQGQIIDQFKLVFENGRIVEFDAVQGKDVLAKLLESDEGARYLGEVAIVPYYSPISDMKTLFFNTLYDENASCHFAFGEAYPCFIDADEISEQEMIERGKNKSIIHVDFMVGTEKTKIVGVKPDGTQEDILVDGSFVI